jgi:polar amino acid transport system ATP-binding protein
MDDVILSVENLSKTFGTSQVLRSVSFSVKKGETKVFIGPSGTGKTTLLRCINQLTPPDTGTVRLHGEEVTATSPKINYFRQKMGMVFQNFYLFDHLTAVKNIELALIRVQGLSRDEAHTKALQELERVGLRDKADCYPAELSGGQQQRVAIARALAGDPDVMLFDEPTSALDPERISEVLEIIRDLAKSGMTMLIITHEMSFALSVASEILFMEQGQIVERGTPQEMQNNPDFQRTRAFLSHLGDHAGPMGQQR